MIENINVSLDKVKLEKLWMVPFFAMKGPSNMNSLISRLLHGASALVFAFGGVMHAAAFAAKALPSIDGSNLPPFFGAELKVLWLADSATLIALALIFAVIAVKPAVATRTIVMLIALIPFATTLLLYFFLGPFYAGHLLLAACVMAVVAGFLMPGQAGSAIPNANDIARTSVSAVQ